MHATPYRDDDSPVPSAYRRQWAWQSLSTALSLTACVRMTARCPGVRRWYVKGDIDIDIDERAYQCKRNPAVYRLVKLGELCVAFLDAAMAQERHGGLLDHLGGRKYGQIGRKRGGMRTVRLAFSSSSDPGSWGFAAR